MRLPVARGAFWTLLGAAVVVAALFLSWRALAALDFGYPLAYEVLGIEHTIATYGPENERRPAFHTTSRSERERLFGEIAAAVRNRGRGLDAIAYGLRSGRTVPMLTSPEIQHLRDVAVLVTGFERVGWGALGVAAALMTVAWARRWPAPSTRRFGAGVGLGAAVVSLAVLAVGPVRVFYWLHERVFPPDHPWFFWYEESLMSMLMQAPNLFGVIALAWLALAVAAACGIWYLAGLLLPARPR